MNLPNSLTISRIVLTAIFMIFIFMEGFLFKSLALATFLIAAFTDYLDGKLARSRHLITELGILLDPIADKLLTISALLVFVQMDLVPAWMVVVVVARELLVTALRFLSSGSVESKAASRSGKNKTIFQFIFIVLVLIFIVARSHGSVPESRIPELLRWIYFGMLINVVLTLWSGVRFLKANPKMIKP